VKCGLIYTICPNLNPEGFTYKGLMLWNNQMQINEQRSK
jgi:hypothetical protein